MRSATKKRTGKHPKYLAFIRSLPCVCCCILDFGPDWLVVLVSPIMRGQHPAIESAHVGVRGLSQKCSDLETIPLCGDEHHREGRFSAHKLGKKFWDHWGIDKAALLAKLQEEFKREKP